jgi:hypothetical protein
MTFTCALVTLRQGLLLHAHPPKPEQDVGPHLLARVARHTLE